MAKHAGPLNPRCRRWLIKSYIMFIQLSSWDFHLLSSAAVQSVQPDVVSLQRDHFPELLPTKENKRSAFKCLICSIFFIGTSV